MTGEAPLIGGRPTHGDGPKPASLQQRKRRAAALALIDTTDVGLPDSAEAASTVECTEATMECTAAEQAAATEEAQRPAAEQAAAEPSTEPSGTLVMLKLNTPRASHLAPLASRLSPLASRLAPLASRHSPLASRLSPLASHPTRACALCAGSPTRCRVASSHLLSLASRMARSLLHVNIAALGSARAELDRAELRCVTVRRILDSDDTALSSAAGELLISLHDLLGL